MKMENSTLRSEPQNEQSLVTADFVDNAQMGWDLKMVSIPPKYGHLNGENNEKPQWILWGPYFQTNPNQI
jgi:hypothetical protein